jgi:hypothetical protein
MGGLHIVVVSLGLADLHPIQNAPNVRPLCIASYLSCRMSVDSRTSAGDGANRHHYPSVGPIENAGAALSRSPALTQLCCQGDVKCPLIRLSHTPNDIARSLVGSGLNEQIEHAQHGADRSDHGTAACCCGGASTKNAPRRKRGACVGEQRAILESGSPAKADDPVSGDVHIDRRSDRMPRMRGA